jgi:hypothetical protein
MLLSEEIENHTKYKCTVWEHAKFVMLKQVVHIFSPTCERLSMWWVTVRSWAQESQPGAHTGPVLLGRTYLSVQSGRSVLLQPPIHKRTWRCSLMPGRIYRLTKISRKARVKGYCITQFLSGASHHREISWILSKQLTKCSLVSPTYSHEEHTDSYFRNESAFLLHRYCYLQNILPVTLLLLLLLLLLLSSSLIWTISTEDNPSWEVKSHTTILKEFPVFYWTRRFITVLIRSRHWSVYTWIQSITSYFIQIHFNIILLYISCDIFPSGLPTKISYMQFPSLLCVLHVPIAYFLWFYQPNKIWCREQIMKLHLSTASSLLNSDILLSTLFSHTLSAHVLPSPWETKFHTRTKTSEDLIIILCILIFTFLDISKKEKIFWTE